MASRYATAAAKRGSARSGANSGETQVREQMRLTIVDGVTKPNECAIEVATRQVSPGPVARAIPVWEMVGD
jgi:hypothetical protein